VHQDSDPQDARVDLPGLIPGGEVLVAQRRAHRTERLDRA
jgi:hypothetical protein